MPLTPEQRRLRAQLAANSRHARESVEQGRASTSKARAAAFRRFEDQVDPDRVLDPAERARRAEYARKAHMQRMAFESSKARRAKRGVA